MTLIKQKTKMFLKGNSINWGSGLTERRSLVFSITRISSFHFTLLVSSNLLLTLIIEALF
jgi:hypothetical protein